jgi:SAM-dependent methyltransferase
VGERALVGERYLADRELRRQYEAEIAPRTRAALDKVLGQIGPERLGGVRRVLDLGAGTGAAGALIRERLGPGVEVVSVDRVATGPEVVVADLRQRGRPRGVEGQFDLVVAAHLLNELSASLDVTARAALVFSWGRELLAESGLIVLLEPALRETSRELLAVRDRLVTAGFFVVAPCLWQGPCPALARERDWCHDSVAWPGPVEPARAGQSRVDFSYLVLTRGGEASRERRLYRVVSDPIFEKGRLRIWGCGPAGRQALIRLDRDRAEANSGLDQAARGDLIVAADTERAGDGLRIGPASRVERR